MKYIVAKGCKIVMRVRHRFAFRTDETEASAFLDEQRIEYSKSEAINVFYMFEDEENFDVIRGFMKSRGSVEILEAVYTKSEFDIAEWFTVRSSWRSLYPHPKDNMSYRFTTYDTSDYCEGDEPSYICRKGAIQKECFALEKEPKWGSRNFLMLHWVGDELFISSRAELQLRDTGITGYSLYDVQNKKGAVLNGVKQMLVYNVLGEALRENAIQEKLICPVCGFAKYLQKVGANLYRKEAFDNVEVDVVKTKEKFGEITCCSKIIVSRRFYASVVSAMLDRCLVFEPVVLI